MATATLVDGTEEQLHYDVYAWYNAVYPNKYNEYIAKMENPLKPKAVKK